MDPVRELIKLKLAEKGLELAPVSRQIGRNHSYMQQFMERNIPLELKEKDRRRLAEILDVDEDELRRPDPALPIGMPSIKPERPPQNARIGGPIQAVTTVPAYGHAAGGSHGQFPLNGNKIDDILAPPKLAGVRDAYAVYVAGTSMVPRYRTGEAVFVHPGLPVRKEDYVVAQILSEDEGEPPDAYVKMFLSQDAKYLRLLQHNPRRELKFPRRKVWKVHRIIMGGEG